MKHLLEKLYARLARWVPPPPDFPHPPHSRVLEPKPRTPGGRRDAIAVAEPEPDVSVDARASS
jgi:hypothetical protein